MWKMIFHKVSRLQLGKHFLNDFKPDNLCIINVSKTFYSVLISYSAGVGNAWVLLPRPLYALMMCLMETATIVRMAVFRVVSLCTLVYLYQRLRGPYCLFQQCDDTPLPDHGGSTDL